VKTYLDCYPCFLRQAVEAARLAGANGRQQREILGRVLDLLRDVPLSSVPPEIVRQVHRVVRDVTGVEDPYQEVKARSTEEALALYPWLKTIVAEAEDRLETAARLSIAGNIIDMGPNPAYDLRDEVMRVLAEPFAADDSEALLSTLNEADSVLYLADNAGETVFDRLLIEAIDAPMIYAVKGRPIINDATVEDARAAGVDQVAEVMSNGSDSPGTLLEACSDAFRRTYDEAEVIIAKGQANYETLSDEGPRVFFLLQTKCPVIARDLGMPAGGLIITQGQGDGAGREYEKERQP
jgi:uncharacterized protein with ATP-grasp and redox domains